MDVKQEMRSGRKEAFADGCFTVTRHWAPEGGCPRLTSGLPTTRELIGLVRTMFLVEIEWEAKTHLIPPR